LQEVPAQGGAPGVFGDISREQIARDVRIGQFEKVGEGGAFITCSLAVTFTQVTNEKEIELLHPAAALPLKSAVVHGCDQCCRSSIIFLISAIAFAGLRSFGQASVQFMMVWQR
jgi:hypothetical protein